MNILLKVSLIALVLAVLVLISVVRFLGNELKKKFRMNWNRIQKEHVREYYFDGSRDTFNKPPHMRYFHVQSISRKPYFLTVYLLLDGGLADPFAFLRSDQSGRAILSTYVGLGEAHFAFVATPDMELKVSATEQDQRPNIYGPDLIVQPHWFQRGVFWQVVGWFTKNVLHI